MKVITAYETEDGEIFSSRYAAQCHELDRRVVDGLRAFWDQHGYSGMTAEDAASLCAEHRLQLRDILLAVQVTEDGDAA